MPEVGGELPPPVVVYPGESLTLRTDVVHDPGSRGLFRVSCPPDEPEVEWIDRYAWSEGYWKACGGTVVSADERTIVYQATRRLPIRA